MMKIELGQKEIKLQEASKETDVLLVEITDRCWLGTGARKGWGVPKHRLTYLLVQLRVSL